jgi:hypothetical protein
LKVIHKILTERGDAVERFRQEVKAAARLSHVNIVTAYDAERAGDLHFLVMEFVEGSNLEQLVATRGPLSVTSACHIVREAALGLQHAFERGMVHRDIKPANVLLTATGQVKVLDFGLARFVRANSGGSLTAPGVVLGTPDYLAPEQALDASHADIRSDIYSLGCTLYFLLAARPPFLDGSVLQKLMAHQERRPRPLGELRDDVPVELLAVLERTMAKDPARRYQTPAEVTERLEPFISGDMPPTISTTALSLEPSRRRSGWPRLAAVVLLLLAAIGGILWRFSWHKEADAPNARDEVRRIDGNSRPFTRAVLSPDCRQALVVVGEDFNVRLWDLDKGEEVGRLEGHTAAPMGLAISRDGRFALSGGMDKTVRLWDLRARRLLQTLEGHSSWVRSVAFAGENGLAVSGGNNARVLLWDARGGQLLSDFREHLGLVYGIAASRSGRLAVSASQDRTIRVWDLVDRRPTHCLRGHKDSVICAVLSEDERYVLSGSSDKTIRLWDLKAEKQLGVLSGHTLGVNTVAISNDNRRALSGGLDGTVRLWDLQKGAEIHCFTGHAPGAIKSVAFHPDGLSAVSVSDDGTFRFWRLP